jgi:hypothetical protein
LAQRFGLGGIVVELFSRLDDRLQAFCAVGHCVGRVQQLVRSSRAVARESERASAQNPRFALLRLEPDRLVGSR